ncbi:hypothetical protein OIU76_017938, partial [Salix suchowensis]
MCDYATDIEKEEAEMMKRRKEKEEERDRKIRGLLCLTLLDPHRACTHIESIEY